MPKIEYIPRLFNQQSRNIIGWANTIIEEYQAQGFDITLRQLYYQFVSRDLIENKDSEYKRLGSIIGDARLAGLIDWEAISDRTRNLRSNAHWRNERHLMRQASQWYANDKWLNQPCRVEAFIEKDALVGILESACESLDVPHFSCRGYTSLSELWAAAQRMRGYAEGGQEVVLLHLGDHDPSGIDMTRDIRDRLALFGANVIVRRIALNYDQIEEYNPPPNPAKVTDSRFNGYQVKYGDESWELDALEPSVLIRLITDSVLLYRDEELWETACQIENESKERIGKVATHWEKVAKLVDKQKG